MDNFLLHASGISLADKIEECNTFALCHAHLYLAGSDDDLDDKSTAENTIDTPCGGGGSRSSL